MKMSHVHGNNSNVYFFFPKGTFIKPLLIAQSCTKRLPERHCSIYGSLGPKNSKRPLPHGYWIFSAPLPGTLLTPSQKWGN